MKKRISIGCFILCFLFSFSPCVYGYTVDDVRDLLGLERVDEMYTQEEIDTITREYTKIREQNRQYELFELVNSTSSNEETLEKRVEIEEQLARAKEDLANCFQGGVALPEVMRKKSLVESLLVGLGGLGDLNTEVEVEYIPNTWEDEYKKVSWVVESLNSQYDIGDVGKDMKIPVDYGFYIEYPYGLRLNLITFDSVEMHNGIDFGVSFGTYVYAQWTGTVSKVYNDRTMGEVIEISHGPDLRTVYAHLSEIYVKVGDRVNQYDAIGKSGDTGSCNTEKPHLHFEVILDNQYVNPIYLYGSKGLRAFKTFVSENSKLDFNKRDVEVNLKDYPTKVVEETEVSNEESVEYEGKFEQNEFFKNKEKWYKELEEKEEYQKSILGG